MPLSIRKLPHHCLKFRRLLKARSFSQIDYSLRCMFPRWGHYDIQYTRKGQIKRRVRQSVIYLTFVASIVGLYQARKRGEGLLSLFDTLRQQARGVVVGVLTHLEGGIRSIQGRI